VPKRVLIVDDEENIREMTRHALEAVGYEVGEAGSGLEAFAAIGADESWDAVLLDQKMPEMAGIEVLRRLKIMLPKAPVIMMTAYASIDLAVEAMKLGASDFVRKPMTPEILRNAVAAALSSKGDPGGDRPKDISRRITLNGFTVIRAKDTVAKARTDEHAFIVKAGDGREHEVVVQIAPEAISSVENVSTGLVQDTASWTEQAEQFLCDFLWNDGNAPATGRLTLKRVEREALERPVRKEVAK
jgi:CheY-like chemotaxis protein